MGSSTWKRPPLGHRVAQFLGKLATSAAFSPMDASNVSHFFNRLLEVKRPVRLRNIEQRNLLFGPFHLPNINIFRICLVLWKMAKQENPANVPMIFSWMIPSYDYTRYHPKTSTIFGPTRAPGARDVAGPQPMLSNRLLMADSTTQSWSSKATCLGYSGSNMVQKWWRTHGICW